MAVERFSSALISSQWFTEFCTSQELRLLNAQSLEQLRKKHCIKIVLEKFYHFLQVTIHQIPHLLYNMDETSCCTNKRGKIVVPEGKYLFVSEELSVGHITMCCTSNAEGEALPPFIILPLILNLPDELTEFQSQCYFVTLPSGWFSSRIFTIWSIVFAGEIAKRR